jgi:hypothetical protein
MVGQPQTVFYSTPNNEDGFERSIDPRSDELNCIPLIDDYIV